MNEFVSLCVLLRLLLARPRLSVRREHRPHLVERVLRRDARLGGDRDLVELIPACRTASAQLECRSPASVAPPIVETVPNLTSPEMRSLTTGPCDCTPISSPTLKCFLFAVDWSITTCSPCGHVPSTSVSGLKREAPFAIEKPRFGAPPKTIALPSEPIRCASPSTPPSATSTVGERPHLVREPTPERGRRRAAVRARRRLAGDDDVRALTDVGEDRVERLVDRVGEHEGAAHHRDAEHDRDRREGRAELAPEQAGQRDAGHEPARAIAARISVAPLRGSSSTMRPSARNSTRSAIVGGVRVVRHHHHRLVELHRRGSKQLEDVAPPSASRGCPSARRRRRPWAWRRAHVRSRRAAADRRRAPTDGACADR